MTVLITLSIAGTDSGPFDLYSNNDGYTSAFESGVSKAALLAGYPCSLVPDYTVVIRVRSNNGLCTNYVDIPVIESPTTTTSTTAVPTTTTTTSFYACNTFGSATSFAVLGKSNITNTGITNITGDLGLYPGTSVTGFPPGVVTGTQHITDIDASNAQLSADAAYICLSGLTPISTLSSDIGGTTITPGVYDTLSSLAITGTVILDGLGDPDAVFVFQIPSTFIPAASAVVSLINGTQAGNVYWLVGSSATLSANSTIFGNIISQVSIIINSGATLTGKAFALTGSVTLNTNTITNAYCTSNPCIPTTTTTSSSSTTTSTTTTSTPTTTTTTTITLPLGSSLGFPGPDTCTSLTITSSFTDGGGTLTQRGVCYNTTGNPTIADSIFIGPTVTGISTINVTGLIPSTNYYWRAYAINEIGVSYYQTVLANPTGLNFPTGICPPTTTSTTTPIP